ncbi:MAG: hypothetical protein ACYDEX_24365 [Mobilitalea sp.]
MLKEWRDKLTSQEKTLLNHIYSHWSLKYEWPSSIAVAVKFRKEIDLYNFARQIGGKFIQSGEPGRKESRVELSIYGIALCDKSESDIDLFINTMKYCIKKYIEDPENPIVTSDDLKNNLKLNTEELKKAYFLIRGARFWSSGGGNVTDYKYELYYDIMKYETVNNIDDFYKIMEGEFIPIRFGGKEEKYELGNLLSINDEREIEPYKPIDVSFIRNERIKEVIEMDLEELHYVLRVGAWKSATILSASVAESLLLYLFEINEEIARRTLKDKWPNRASLTDMISAASISGLIDEPDKAIYTILSVYRNQIHPNRAKFEKRPDEYVAIASSNLVYKMVKDMERNIK